MTQIPFTMNLTQKSILQFLKRSIFNTVSERFIAILVDATWKQKYCQKHYYKLQSTKVIIEIKRITPPPPYKDFVWKPKFNCQSL